MEVHCHEFSGVTSNCRGHEHTYKGKTTYAPNNGFHIHFAEGLTSLEDGHRHYFGLCTSVGFPAPGGGHYHVIRPIAKVTRQHIHLIRNSTTAFR